MPHEETHVSADDMSASDWLNHLSDAPPFGDINQMWEWMRTRHGEVADVLRGVVERRHYGDSSEDLYAIKNADLQLSLDMGIGYSRALYEAQLERVLSIAASRPSPKRVLDPGCENGILTCFYGQLWPAAEIVGVDLSAAAIARANDLRDRVGVSNVAFFEGDYAGEVLRDHGSFDFVLASRTLLFEQMDTPAFVPPLGASVIAPIPTVDQPEGWEYPLAIASALRDDGLLLSLERCGSPGLFPTWLSCLAALDLGISWGMSDWLAFDEVGIARAEPYLALSHQESTESWDHTMEFLLARPAESTWPPYLWGAVGDRVGQRNHVVGVELIPFDGSPPQSIVIEQTTNHFVWLNIRDGAPTALETYPVSMSALGEEYLLQAVEQASDIGTVRKF